MISIKSEQELLKMRRAGEVVAGVFEVIQSEIKPGVSTAHIDKIVYEYITKQGCTPSFKGYGGFPASICTSVNEEVVHGIPGNRILKDGDILSVDVGACFEGYHADAARTYPVGNITPEAQRLIDVTKESFFVGMKQATAGNRIGDIASAIQQYVESQGYSVVRALVGHGIGAKLHEDPEVPNYGIAGRGARLQKGMTIAVEPMVNMGHYDVYTLDNEWTVVTDDNSLSAHYENTVIITDGEPEFTTLR
ncbi:MAG: type I methionyl aminopeptidase [Clostridia bacterium]|nr:type I methionyl aminopeptidase [Clostridia bacterium]